MPSGDALQFYFMHFMPYAQFPPDHDAFKSVWVDYSNDHYDPVVGNAFYHRYMKEMVLADELGFDAIVVNEHHSSPYSMMPACTIMAGTLIAQTARATVCIFGTPVNLTYPNRLAEEYAMLDVMSAVAPSSPSPSGSAWSTCQVPPT